MRRHATQLVRADAARGRAADPEHGGRSPSVRLAVASEARGLDKARAASTRVVAVQRQAGPRAGHRADDVPRHRAGSDRDADRRAAARGRSSSCRARRMSVARTSRRSRRRACSPPFRSAPPRSSTTPRTGAPSPRSATSSSSTRPPERSRRSECGRRPPKGQACAVATRRTPEVNVHQADRRQARRPDLDSQGPRRAQRQARRRAVHHAVRRRGDCDFPRTFTVAARPLLRAGRQPRRVGRQPLLGAGSGAAIVGRVGRVIPRDPDPAPGS